MFRRFIITFHYIRTLAKYFAIFGNFGLDTWSCASDRAGAFGADLVLKVRSPHADELSLMMTKIVREQELVRETEPDGLRRLAVQRPLYGYQFTGVRHDAGNKLGFLKATVEFALKREDLGRPFREYLKSLKL